MKYICNGLVILPIAIERIEPKKVEIVTIVTFNYGPVVLPIAIGRIEQRGGENSNYSHL